MEPWHTIYLKQNQVPDRPENDDCIKCVNYDRCKELIPKWWYDFKGHFRCARCDLVLWEAFEKDRIQEAFEKYNVKGILSENLERKENSEGRESELVTQ